MTTLHMAKGIHDSLKHLKGKGKLNRQHAKWVELIETSYTLLNASKVKKTLWLTRYQKSMFFYLL